MNHTNPTNLRQEPSDKNRTDKMIIPIRCFSCGKPIAHEWPAFKEEMKKGGNLKKSLDKAGLKRQCCRAIFMSQVDAIDIISKYQRG